MRRHLLVLLVGFILLLSGCTSKKDEEPHVVPIKKIIEPNVTIFLEHVSSNFSQGELLTEDRAKVKAEEFQTNLEYNTAYMKKALDLLGIQKKDDLLIKERTKVICDVLNYIDSSFRYQPDFGDITKRANETLYEGQGDCEDFTILFMSLIATAGIPKEDLRGIRTYENFSGIPDHHIYPEVRFSIFNESIWLPIEVTKNVKTNKLYNTKNFCGYLTSDFGNIHRYYWFNFDDVGIFNQSMEVKRTLIVNQSEFFAFYNMCNCY